MIKKYSDLNIPDGSYPGEGINIVEDIYNPILANSIYHKRSTYSFNSYSLVELSEGLEGFVEHGKKLDLLIGETIQEHELRSVVKGKKNVEKGLQDLCLLKLQKLFEQKDTYDGHLYRLGLLTNLIGSEKLEIRFCFYEKGNKPKQHTKLAIFEGTEGEVIAWDSSSNQSQNGLLDSLESLSLFKSWDPLTGYSVHGDRIHQSFSKMWSGGIGDWKTVAVPSSFYRRYAENFPAIKNNSKSKRHDKKESSKNSSSIKIDLFDHQSEVISNWKENNRQGIVEHATGSGKSFTGIFAIKDFFDNGGSTALVILPGKPLVAQWFKDLSNIFPKSRIHFVGGDQGKDWRGKLHIYSDPNINEKQIILGIAKSVSHDDFTSTIKDGEHLMILADEAHNLGAKDMSNIFKINASAKMALSATIERYGDQEGTQRIKNYFGKSLTPKFGIKEALTKVNPKTGDTYLCQYKYEINSIKLTPDESDDWIEKTKKIKRLAGMLKSNQTKESSDKGSTRQKYDFLVRERAKIHKTAAGKVPLAMEIIKEKYNPSRNQRWLIYCDSNEQLDRLGQLLDDNNFKWMKYESRLGDKLLKTILRKFYDEGGLLLSIGCLDEGVDIEAADHALIIASSKNPRQFIQRRGRVLRRDKNNPAKLAQIFDFAVTPSGVANKMEFASMIKGEVARLEEFAIYAMNNNFCVNFLDDLKDDYQLTDIENDDSYSFEDE